ncbi:Hypothetical protein GbCGDNIH9_8046 [Granulibacter bethesdensis]|uniref:Uncharacterized protein n=1 Tax=Granulibacter bethesdensis TaxID=364410 RepID=A0AAC9P8Q9_9PROT|nr:Hypothetical protein GbCGDNIH9_8046 [Granulibacter bethesdensis]APH61859.1 Hypothetical protein GbCGDNIH8_8046 [Granulibacter bethesdensis]
MAIEWHSLAGTSSVCPVAAGEGMTLPLFRHCLGRSDRQSMSLFTEGIQYQKIMNALRFIYH